MGRQTCSPSRLPFLGSGAPRPPKAPLQYGLCSCLHTNTRMAGSVSDNSNPEISGHPATWAADKGGCGAVLLGRGTPHRSATKAGGIIALRLLVRCASTCFIWVGGLGIFPMLVWGGCRSKGGFQSFGGSRDTALLVFKFWNWVKGRHIII